jgi:hypothetical protein
MKCVPKKHMETLIYERGGAFLDKILKMRPEEVKLLCPICNSELVFAPDAETANRLKTHPGAFCPKDPRHLRVNFHLR